MPIGSILLVTALFFLVMLNLAMPFLKDRKEGRVMSDRNSSLLAERERVLEAILELEFDQQLGKVPEEIFEQQRSQLTEKAIETLKELDKNMPKEISDDELEAMINARKAKRK